MSDKKIPDCTCQIIHKDVVENVKNNLITADDYNNLASLFKMFSDPSRVKLLHVLEKHELCVCDLTFLLGITKSAVSHQLSLLKMANLVKYRREGQVVYYSLADDHVKTLLDIGLEHLFEDA